MLLPRFVAFDPGKTTGVSAWKDPKSTPVLIKDHNEEQLDELLDHLAECSGVVPIEHIIIEEYRVFNDKFNHQGDKVHTAQVIGMLKRFCRALKIPYTEQAASIKGVAALWADVKAPKGHMPDYMAAYLHGYYWLHKNGYIPARVLKEK